MSELHAPVHPVRFVTAASLFDGHDAAINIMRRILQSQGVEVIHLGHNRSVDEVVQAAVAEDVQGVAISSYQGGHMEYFAYLVEQLAARGARRHPRVRRRRRRDRRRPRSPSSSGSACRSSPPRTASGSASPRWSTSSSAECDRDLGAEAAGLAREPLRRVRRPRWPG